MNDRQKGVMLSYLNIMLQAILSFIYVPLLLTYIGKSEYGLYQLIGSLIAYFSIMDFGLTAAVIRFYAKYKALDDKLATENLLALAFYGYSIIAIIIVVVGICIYTELGSIFSNSMTVSEIEEAKKLFLLLLLNGAISLLTMIFRGIINANEKFVILKGFETLQLLLQPILVIIIIQEYPYAYAVAIVQTILNIILSASRIFYCFNYLNVKIKFHHWDSDLFLDFRKLALSVFCVALVDQVFWKTNQIILGILNGTSEVAVYSLSSVIYMNYMALSLAISGVYLPHVTQLVTNKAAKEKLSELFISIGRVQYYLLLLVLTGFIIFGREFIAYWAGTGFEDAYLITLFIIVPFTIDLIQNIGLTILQAMNQYAFRAKVYIGIGILNVLLAIPGGYYWGGIGCAIATGITMFIGNGLIMNWYYKSKVGLDISRFWKEIGKVTLSLLFVFVFGYALNMYWLTTDIIHFGFKLMLYVLFYSIVLFLFVLTTEEKKKVLLFK